MKCSWTFQSCGEEKHLENELEWWKFSHCTTLQANWVNKHTTETASCIFQHTEADPQLVQSNGKCHTPSDSTGTQELSWNFCGPLECLTSVYKYTPGQTNHGSQSWLQEQDSETAPQKSLFQASIESRISRTLVGMALKHWRGHTVGRMGDNANEL